MAAFDTRRAARLLLAAFCLHNLEEALTYARHRGKAGALLEALLGIPINVPSPATCYVLLMDVTLAAALLTFRIHLAPPGRCPRRAVAVSAAILLTKVFVPHLPVALLMSGYAPGVVTAVAINAPLALLVLAGMRRTRPVVDERLR